MTNSLRLRRRKYQGDAFQHLIETGYLAFQVLSAGWSNPVGAYPTVARRNLPLSFDQLFSQQSLQSRIERAFLDLQQIVGSLLDVLHKRIAMHRLTLERL